MSKNKQIKNQIDKWDFLQATEKYNKESHDTGLPGVGVREELW